MERADALVEAVEERAADQLVRIRFPDGREESVSAPSVILIEVGMRVGITQTGDSAPIYDWG